MPLPLDPARVRANFPAFAEPSLAGQAFFENAGGSYISRQVLDRFDRYFRTTKVQPYAPYPASQAAGEAMDLAYERIAAALNVTSDWVHFGPSTSANTYVLANAFGQYLRAGDAIVVTDQDHEANTGGWRRLARLGLDIRVWPIDPQTGRLDLASLDPLLDARVKLVAFPHVSNVVGEVNPVAEIVARAHAVGARTVVDGVAYAPHGLPDLEALGADIYLFSAYKVYGPHLGVMAVRPELAAALPNQGHHFNEGEWRKRLNPAGPDHAQIAAAAGIADYLEAVSGMADPVVHENPFRRAHEAMRAQEIALSRPLLDWITSRNHIRIVGPTEPDLRAPTISLLLDEPGLDVARRLSAHGIMASGGFFYAHRVMVGLGVPLDHGVLRLSFLHYTSPAEIDQLIAALDAELGA